MSVSARSKRKIEGQNCPLKLYFSKFLPDKNVRLLRSCHVYTKFELRSKKKSKIREIKIAPFHIRGANEPSSPIHPH